MPRPISTDAWLATARLPSAAMMDRGTHGQRQSPSDALCTAALEMSALLLDIQPGDEIIMPSYTFVSTANAFVLRGGVPVFVDIREDTLNLDERLIEAAITPRTRRLPLSTMLAWPVKWIRSWQSPGVMI